MPVASPRQFVHAKIVGGLFFASRSGFGGVFFVRLNHSYETMGSGDIGVTKRFSTSWMLPSVGMCLSQHQVHVATPGAAERFRSETKFGDLQ